MDEDISEVLAREAELAEQNRDQPSGPLHPRSQAWRPTWKVHPGELLDELLTEMNLPLRLTAEATGIPEADLLAVIECRAPITPQIARGLAKLPSSEQLWLNLQRDYDRPLA